MVFRLTIEGDTAEELADNLASAARLTLLGDAPVTNAPPKRGARTRKTEAAEPAPQPQAPAAGFAPSPLQQQPNAPAGFTLPPAPQLPQPAAQGFAPPPPAQVSQPQAVAAPQQAGPTHNDAYEGLQKMLQHPKIGPAATQQWLLQNFGLQGVANATPEQIPALVAAINNALAAANAQQ